MRLGLLLSPLLLSLAGCIGEQGPPQPGPGPLPPSLLLDRLPNGTLQLYLHAKHGNVRYGFLNVTVENTTQVSRPFAYAIDLALGVKGAHLAVEAVEGEVPYHWEARYQLNETGPVPLLTVETYDGHENGYAVGREFGLPYEKLLPREEH